MVTADHGLAGARYAENYSELHHFHLDLRDVKAFAVCPWMMKWWEFTDVEVRKVAEEDNGQDSEKDPLVANQLEGVQKDPDKHDWKKL